MKRRMFVTVVALVVAFVAGGAIAYAQRATAEIEFPFVAGGKDMAAGKYTVELNTVNATVLLRGSSGVTYLPIITTLGRHDKDPGAEFVFDKLDGKLHLSEIWMPGKDGYLILATTRQHEHAVVGGSNPRK